MPEPCSPVGPTVKKTSAQPSIVFGLSKIGGGESQATQERWWATEKLSRFVPIVEPTRRQRGFVQTHV